MAKRENWDRDQIILALDLYYRTPYGRIHASNSEICELAGLIHRTPSAVVYKMGNLAFHDPVLRSKNKTGLSHGAKLDGIVFEEFSSDLASLSEQARIIRERLGAKDIDKFIDMDEIQSIRDGKYREYMLKVRLGQSAFRKSILGLFNNKCCVTGLALPEMLIASHIKPWAKSDEHTERTNPRNGLCLNAFHDRMFDQGFMTIDKNYKIYISSRIKEVDMNPEIREWFLKYEGSTIWLPQNIRPGAEFIEYHNDEIYIK